MMHESGTGGAPKYGTVAQMPVAGSVTNPLLSDYFSPRSTTDEASVGYYKLTLSSGVVTELAGTNHAGMFSYIFPTTYVNTTGSVVIDVSHILQDFRGLGWEENYIAGNITIGADRHYEGSGTYDGGWNLGKSTIIRKKS